MPGTLARAPRLCGGEITLGSEHYARFRNLPLRSVLALAQTAVEPLPRMNVHGVVKKEDAEPSTTPLPAPGAHRTRRMASQLAFAYLCPIHPEFPAILDKLAFRRTPRHARLRRLSGCKSAHAARRHPLKIESHITRTFVTRIIAHIEGLGTLRRNRRGHLWLLYQ